MKQRYTIVCADDDPEILRVYTRLLERRGHTVHTAMNGAEVLQVVEQQPADLIIMDAKMPVMDGMTACEQLRRRPDSLNVPIIFVSGYTNEEDILYCLAMGGTDFICKPFQPGELMAKVAYALRRYYETMDNDVGLPLGTRIAGRYEIIALLDTGGFSKVYRARDVTSNENALYALKVFDFPFAQHSNQQFLYTILREAYQLCKLDHPCIVKILDFGQFGSIIFIVLEYVHGKALDILVEQRGPFSELNSAFVGLEVTDALRYMDGKDILHRDIKPDNIMISYEGDVKLVDFGLAKQRSEQTLSVDRNEFQGTAQFVSPENIDGRDVDIESDIYSLGTSIYYLVTGVKPFDGPDLTNILHRQLNETPKPVREINPELTPEFSELIGAMLEKRPEDRPTIDEVHRGFAQVLERDTGDRTSHPDLKTAVGEEEDIRMPNPRM